MRTHSLKTLALLFSLTPWLAVSTGCAPGSAGTQEGKGASAAVTGQTSVTLTFVSVDGNGGDATCNYDSQAIFQDAIFTMNGNYLQADDDGNATVTGPTGTSATIAVPSYTVTVATNTVYFSTDSTGNSSPVYVVVATGDACPPPASCSNRGDCTAGNTQLNGWSCVDNQCIYDGVGAPE